LRLSRAPRRAPPHALSTKPRADVTGGPAQASRLASSSGAGEARILSPPAIVKEVMATEIETLTNDLHAGRARFLDLVADIRPDLHRYCARMTGSVSAGEDVVQDALAHAYYALGEMHSLPPLRSWLFQIAHRRSIDYLRRYDRRMGQPLEVVSNVRDATAFDPEESVAREEAIRAAISAFLQLPPAQRSCVILKDVLGHSVDEIAPLLELTRPKSCATPPSSTPTTGTACAPFWRKTCDWI
jgi:RNA polymerase sigma factor (sigma-70 family)